MHEMTTGALIRQLRLEKRLTQAELAGLLHVSAKAVSKWERSAGLPDVSVIPALSRALDVSPEALMSGRVTPNTPEGGNMKRIQFFQCPGCGNLLTASGSAEISCCGRRLAPMKRCMADDAHALTISDVETEKLVTWTHPMTKAHHLTFIAAIGADCVHLVRLYPEGASEHRLPRIPWATWVCGCTEAPDTLFVSK